MEAIKITIPGPCHEDWDKMSPREKGHFCGKCRKTVTDFSLKTPIEIQQFILEHEHEKLCGRFKNNQLNRLIRLEIPYLKLVRRLTAKQAFILSLLIVFGTTLFSCTTHTNKTVGEFSLIDPMSPKLIEVDTIASFIADEVSLDKPVNIDMIEREDFNTEEENNAYQQSDTTIELRAVEITAQKVSYTDGFTIGALKIDRISGKLPEATTDSVSIEKNLVEGNNDFLNEKSVAYPNPAYDFIKLRLVISYDEALEVELYDLNGKFINTLITSHKIAAGEREFQFDVTNLKPSTYLLRIIIGERIETKRIVVL